MRSIIVHVHAWSVSILLLTTITVSLFSHKNLKGTTHYAESCFINLDIATAQRFYICFVGK